MIKLGLEGENIVHSHAFGDVLVALTQDEVLTPVVTFVYGSTPTKYNPRVLYTVISTCYAGEVFAQYDKPYWLWYFFANMGHYNSNVIYERDDTHEPLAAQALAFEQIKKLQSGQPHDKHSPPSPARLQPSC
jgi:hypothetical protein